MPLYEYVCPQCDTRFEQLRSASRMDEPATCPAGHAAARRVFSTFAALSKDSSGETSSFGAGCGGCGGACANCTCSLN